MNKQQGFTLIELVVVIVILGILSVTAAPRFLNLQSDARVSALQGMKGAMAGAGSIVFGKAAINGIERAESGAVDNITIVYGYPEATSVGIGNAVQGLNDKEDWQLSDPTSTSIRVALANSSEEALQNDGCYVEYSQPTDPGITPEITVVKTGC